MRGVVASDVGGVRGDCQRPARGLKIERSYFQPHTAPVGAKLARESAGSCGEDAESDELFASKPPRLEVCQITIAMIVRCKKSVFFGISSK